MPEGPDLGVRQPGEQSQQGREDVLVINDAVTTGAHKDPGKLGETGFEMLHLRAWSAERVVPRSLAKQDRNAQWRQKPVLLLLTRTSAESHSHQSIDQNDEFFSSCFAS